MNSQLTFETLPGIVDISALSVPTTETDVKELADAANKYGFIAAFVMPCNIEHLKERVRTSRRIRCSR